MQRFVTAALAAVALLHPPDAGAQTNPCAGSLTPGLVVRCALDRSPEVRRARLELAALAGRRVSAGTWLPSPPVLALAAAHRGLWNSRPAQELTRDVNWYVTLSQELEIAGQRGARLAEVDAEAAAQVRRLAAVERETAATALEAYFQLLAATEGTQLSAEVADVAQGLGRLAEARVREALLAPVDADVARAETVRLALIPLEAERRARAARATLQTLLGLELPGNPGGLAPKPGSLPDRENLTQLTQHALTLRGEVAAAEAERLAREHQRTRVQRERVPNLTLSLLAQRDGFGERVLGGGLSIPLFLPNPVGPGGSGLVAEASARLEQAEANADVIRRRVTLEVATADAELSSRERAVALFPRELIQRARADLRVLGEGISAGQLSMKEALLAQRTLIELLQAHLDARLALSLAQVEFSRATGRAFPGDEP